MNRDWLFEWTFKERGENLGAHSIHRYPATFIPELARKLITSFSKEGDVILDIFSGSGTTLLESMSLGRKSIGIELNPLAYLIAKTKVTHIPLTISETGFEEWKSLSFEKSYPRLSFHNMDFWYDSQTLESLGDIVGALKEVEPVEVRNLFRISLSEILREISYCNHSGFKMHRSKAKMEKSLSYSKEAIFEKLKKVVSRNVRCASEVPKVNQQLFPNLIFGDSRDFHGEIPEGSVDMILTSPPYGDSQTTVAYGQFSTLSSQILGLESLGDRPVRQLDKSLLGGETKNICLDSLNLTSVTLENVSELFLSRAKLQDDSKDSTRTLKRLKDILAFYEDLDKCLENASKYLASRGVLAMVVSSRVVHGVKINMDSILEDILRKYNVNLRNAYYRDIHNKRMPRAVSPTNIRGKTAPTMTKESILIFEKA